MTELELHEQRREKWRLAGKPIRTIEEARAFLELVGFCLFYPTRPATLVPTFLGAWNGSDVNLPASQKAFSDPRAQEATDMMVRMLREHYAYEAPLFDENVTFLLTASIFPFFLRTGRRAQSQAATEAWLAITVFTAGLRYLRGHTTRRANF